MEPNKEQLNEINQHISDALAQWQDVMLMADADEWAYLLNYSDEDLLNAMYIFQHVAENIAIKNGHINHKNVIEIGRKFKQMTQECFGFDSVELGKKY